MPNVRRFLQAHFAADKRSRRCARKACRRYRACTPPPDEEESGLFRCPDEDDEAWEARLDAMDVAIEDVFSLDPLLWAAFRKMCDNPGLDPWAAMNAVKPADAAPRGRARRKS
jgi:hypothetical protein